MTCGAWMQCHVIVLSQGPEGMGFTGICRSVEYLYIRYLLGGGGGVVEGREMV